MDHKPDQPPTFHLPRRATAADPLRLGILLSGGGRTMTNLAHAIEQQGIPAKIVGVISSRDGVAGLDRARTLGIEPVVIPRKQHDTPATFSDVVWHRLRDAGVELVCQAGFLCLLHIPGDQLGKVINIHPSLLPSFGGKGMYGSRVHQAVHNAGCKVTGCTVHLCDNTYDTGPILIQRTCPVLPTDTPDDIAARVFQEECTAYPQAVQAFAEGNVQIKANQAHITQ